MSLVLVLSSITRGVDSLELKYKVCTAEELRQSVEEFCMGHGTRDTNSFLSLSPYGSINAMGTPNYELNGPLLDILKASRSLSSMRGLYAKQHPRQLFKRTQDSSDEPPLCDYIDSCCVEGCVINQEDLLPHCTRT